jgi:uncharacterized protein YjeT (DUF2065 family)
LTGTEVYELVAGCLLFITGVLQLVFPRQISAFFRRRNERRLPVTQDIRGLSPQMTRSTGALAVAAGLFFVYAAFRL